MDSIGFSPSIRVSGEVKNFKSVLSEPVIEDKFVRSADHSLEPQAVILRPPQEAVDFVKGFQQGLGISPSNLNQKMKMMKKDDFSFYRMNPALFYKDIHGAYADKAMLTDAPAPIILINGDSHAQNFGTFKGPQGKAVWGLNDFDQSEMGSPEWDLERLTTSAVIVARRLNLDKEQEKEIVTEMGMEYFNTVLDIAKGNKKTAYLTENEAEGTIKNLIRDVNKKDNKEFLNKLVSFSHDGQHKLFKSQDLHPLLPEREEEIQTAMQEYEHNMGKSDRVLQPLRILDMAEKLTGGGSSYGLKRYYVLVAGKSPQEPVILEMKQVLSSPVQNPTNPQHNADSALYIENQKKLGCGTNPLWSHTHLDCISYLVREREKEKSDIFVENIPAGKEMRNFFRQTAQALARTHCQSSATAQALARWIGNDKNEWKKTVKNLVNFSRLYATQVAGDREALIQKTS